jgi:hypothetical protein
MVLVIRASRVNFPLPKPSIGGRIGYELGRLVDAVNSLRPISTDDEFVSVTTLGTKRVKLKRGAGSRATASEFRRIRVMREGWLAVEGEDDDGNVIIAMKPYALAFMNNLTGTTYNFGGHGLSAERETDFGTWPEEEGFFIKVRNFNMAGEANEYWHELIWPPYIGEADSVTDGCRFRTTPPPNAYLVVARGSFSASTVAVDDVTLDAYNGGDPVGDSIYPEWTDANFDGRRWVPWSIAGNVLALDAGGLHVPSQ